MVRVEKRVEEHRPFGEEVWEENESKERQVCDPIGPGLLGGCEQVREGWAQTMGGKQLVNICGVRRIRDGRQREGTRLSF